MTLGDKIRNAIRGKGLKMEEAANILGITRTTLFNKLNAAELDETFLQNVNEKLGINLASPERSNVTVAVQPKMVDNVEMKLNLIPLKNKRIIEIWLPADFDKADIKTVTKWLELKESTL